MFGPLTDDIIDNLCWDDPDPEAQCGPTWPQPGSCRFEAFDRHEPLFTSATWTVVVRVGDETIEVSPSSPAPHGRAYIDVVVRIYISTWTDKLRRLGVDVKDAYARHGGDPSTL